MKSKKIIEILKSELEIPVRYRVFREPVSAPYLVYYSSSTDNFGADNRVYEKRENISLELYTRSKDIELEERVEDLLDAHELFWEKYESYIDSEELIQVAYDIY